MVNASSCTAELWMHSGDSLRIVKFTTTRGITNSWLTSSACSIGIWSHSRYWIWLGEFCSYVIIINEEGTGAVLYLAIGSLLGKRRSVIREIKDHVYVRRQTRICTTWPSFPFTCSLLFIISAHKLVVSRNFFIHKNCFELFLSARLLFWEVLNLNLTFAVCRIREA